MTEAPLVEEGLRGREDLTSSGEKAVNEVLGVPSAEYPWPLDECGDCDDIPRYEDIVVLDVTQVTTDNVALSEVPASCRYKGSGVKSVLLLRNCHCTCVSRLNPQ